MADIDSTLRLWSATASSNKPTGATSIGSGLDDNLRQIQATVRQYLASPGTTIASAATVDLSTADGRQIPISGTATVTGLGTEVSGLEYLLTTLGAQVWVNSSSLSLPGAANITTAAGDYMLAQSKGSGNWVIPFFARASGQPVNAGGSATGLTMVAGVVQIDIGGMNVTSVAQTTDSLAFFSSGTSSVQKILISALVGSVSASQTQMESASSNGVIATPGTMNWHPGMPKAWVSFNGTSTPSIRASYNVSSVTRAATGDYTVNFITPFSTGNYCVNVNCGNADNSGYNASPAFNTTPTGSACRVALYDATGTAKDVKFVFASFFGDQ